MHVSIDITTIHMNLYLIKLPIGAQHSVFVKKQLVKITSNFVINYNRILINQ